MNLINSHLFLIRGKLECGRKLTCTSATSYSSSTSFPSPWTSPKDIPASSEWSSAWMIIQSICLPLLIWIYLMYLHLFVSLYGFYKVITWFRAQRNLIIRLKYNRVESESTQKDSKRSLNVREFVYSSWPLSTSYFKFGSQFILTKNLSCISEVNLKPNMKNTLRMTLQTNNFYKRFKIQKNSKKSFTFKKYFLNLDLFKWLRIWWLWLLCKLQFLLVLSYMLNNWKNMRIMKRIL